MNTAVDIINNRVNGLGVSEAEVQTQGSNNIVVNIPKGTNADQAEQQVGTTAALYFRQVLNEVAGTPTKPTPAPSGTPTPKPSGSATPKPSGSATPSSTAKSTASPSSTASKQGRAVTDALKSSVGKAPTPVPTAPPATAPPSTPSTGTGSTTDTTLSPALQAKFAALDCTKKDQRAQIAEGTKPTDKVSPAATGRPVGQVRARPVPDRRQARLQRQFGLRHPARQRLGRQPHLRLQGRLAVHQRHR